MKSILHLVLCRHSVRLIFNKCYEVLLLEQMVNQPPGNKLGQVALEALQTINKILYGREGSMYDEKGEQRLFIKAGKHLVLHNFNSEFTHQFPFLRPSSVSG